VRAAREAERWVGVCGEMAGDPLVAVLLLGMGVAELSMSTFDLSRVKAAVRAVRFDEARGLATRALECPSAREVKALLQECVEARLPGFLRAQRGEG
jgi:phosphocarrier protein FPr